MDYKQLAELYQEAFELTYEHFLTANELVLDNIYVDAVLAGYNTEDEIYCEKLREVEQKILNIKYNQTEVK